MKARGVVEIDRSVADVFAYTNDNVSEWCPTVIEDELIESVPGRVGSRFRCVTEDHGRRLEFQGVVTRFEPPTMSEVELTGTIFDLLVTYHFEDIGGATRVTQDTTVRPKSLFLKLLFFCCGRFLKSSACKNADAELLNLKRILET